MDQIFDGHAHLAVSPKVNATQASDLLIEELNATSVAKTVVLPLVELGYGNADVEKLAARDKRVVPFATVNPHHSVAPDELRSLARSGPYRGLKLHPRLQKFSLHDPKLVPLLRAAGELNWPVVIDCFPDRTLYEMKALPLDYDQLCVQCPETKIIMAHSGGYRVFEALTMAKFHKNLYLDLSFSLLYYRGSSVTQDLAYAIRNLKGQRILFGTDYPDRTLKISIEDSLKEIDAMGLPADWKEAVLWKNLDALL